jgi:hypothetical protein
MTKSNGTLLEEEAEEEEEEDVKQVDEPGAEELRLSGEVGGHLHCNYLFAQKIFNRHCISYGQFGTI